MLKPSIFCLIESKRHFTGSMVTVPALLQWFTVFGGKRAFALHAAEQNSGIAIQGIHIQMKHQHKIFS
jgi:hypothetical protein